MSQPVRPSSSLSLDQSLNTQLHAFLNRVQSIFELYHVEFQENKENAYEAIKEFLLPKGEDEPIDNQALSSFLQETLNNHNEKTMKKKYCTKDITQISCSTKLFPSPQSVFVTPSPLIAFPSLFKDPQESSSQSQQKEESQNGSRAEESSKQKVKEEEMDSVSTPKSDSAQQYEGNKGNYQSKKHYLLFSTSLKEQIIEYAANFGIKEASERYQISSSKIGAWSRSLSKSKHTRGRKPIDPDMEERVCKWLRAELDRKAILTQKIIRDKAKKISCSDDFKASKGWLEKFFKRRPELFKAYAENRKVLSLNKSGDAKIQQKIIEDYIGSIGKVEFIKHQESAFPKIR